MNRFALFIAFMIVALGLCDARAAAFKRTSEGDYIKNFTLETSDGEMLTLFDNVAEKANVLVFWASWSPRSADLLKDLEIYIEEHIDKGVPESFRLPSGVYLYCNRQLVIGERLQLGQLRLHDRYIGLGGVPAAGCARP